MATITKRMKRATVIAVIVVGVPVLAAIVIGVLNALVADGSWTFGWNDYRYDETGYQIGSGSLPSESISSIELDWIDGVVEIVACEDRYVSLTEGAEEALPESAQLRWRIDEAGNLSIKYRKSSWFFGIGSGGRQKRLTLRIPEALFEKLTLLDIDVASANTVISGVRADKLVFESASGSLLIKDSHFSEADVESVSGKLGSEGLTVQALLAETTSGSLSWKLLNTPSVLELSSVSGGVLLALPAEPSFTLDWESTSGRISHDIPMTEQGGAYVAGSGESRFLIKTVSGDLTLTAIAAAE